MAAPEWVVERLQNWGRWMTEGGSGGLGFPRSNVIALHRGTAASTDHVPVDGIAAQATHRAVALLRADRMTCYVALNCRYVGSPMVRSSARRPLLLSEIAQVMRVTEHTAGAYVLAGQLAVADTLTRWQMKPALG